jgi:hypothetical protein
MSAAGIPESGMRGQPSLDGLATRRPLLTCSGGVADVQAPRWSAHHRETPHTDWRAGLSPQVAGLVAVRWRVEPCMTKSRR